MATVTGKAGEDFSLGRSQTQSDFSDTSSVSESRHLFDAGHDGDKEQSNVPMTSFNFINSIIGSGMIGIPFALKQSGFGLGIILLLLVAIITDYSIIMLIEAGKLSNTNTYQDMMLVAFGRPGFFLLTGLQFIYPFVAMVSYNVIIGDTITKIIRRLGGHRSRANINTYSSSKGIASTLLGNRQFIILMMSIMITLPLSLYRNISKLSKWAFISLMFVGIILVFVCIRMATFADEIYLIQLNLFDPDTLGGSQGVRLERFHCKSDIPATEHAWNLANVNITQAIGIMAFAYMCHHNTFMIHASLENPTKERWNFVTHVSVLFCMVFMLIFSMIGYTSFTGWTQGDLLENYCNDDDLMNVGRFLFALTIMLTYPIECFVTRDVVENAFFPNNQPSPLWRHILVTVVITFLVGVLSMATDCLGIVLELNGVLAASPLAFIIPPVCLMKLRQERVISKSNVIPIAIATFGSLVAIIGFIMAVINFSEGRQCSHGEEMPYCLVSQVVIASNTSNYTSLT